MGRCTAVEILELDEKLPETVLRDERRLPLLNEVWRALTERERRVISDRLDANQRVVVGASVQVTAGAHNDWLDIDDDAVLDAEQSRVPNQ